MLQLAFAPQAEDEDYCVSPESKYQQLSAGLRYYLMAPNVRVEPYYP